MEKLPELEGQKLIFLKITKKVVVDRDNTNHAVLEVVSERVCGVLKAILVWSKETKYYNIDRYLFIVSRLLLFLIIYIIFSKYNILFEQKKIWTKEKSYNLLFFIYQKMII